MRFLKMSTILVFTLIVGCSSNESGNILNVDETQVQVEAAKTFQEKELDLQTLFKLPVTSNILARDDKNVYTAETNWLYQYDTTNENRVGVVLNGEYAPNMARIGDKYLVTSNSASVNGYLANDEFEAMKPLWTFKLPDTDFIALSDIEEDKYIYYGTGNIIAKHDVTTGEMIWETEISNYRPTELKLVEDSILHIGEDFVITVDRETGKVLIQDKPNESSVFEKFKPLNFCRACSFIGIDQSNQIYVSNLGKIGVITNGEFKPNEDLNIPYKESRLINPIVTIQNDIIILYENNLLWVKDLTKNEQWTLYKISQKSIEFVHQIGKHLYVRDEQHIYEINLEKIFQ